MNTVSRAAARGAVALNIALVLAALVLLPAPAQADTAPADPADPATPATASAEALPTVQINGVVWSQAIIGNTVYVGGEFSAARPAGAAPGTNETPRSNLLAYDIRTGQLLASWAPTANGTVNSVVASPDGSRVYVGGVFTSINGQFVRRIAALNPTTGAVIPSFLPGPDARVRAIVATEDTVYYGGAFSAVQGQTRARLAAARASDGALLDWAPSAANGIVWAMDISPDASQLLVAGSFTTLNGSSNPGRGMGSVDAVTGGLRPWASNGLIWAAGDNGAMTAVRDAGDGTVYASGYTFGRNAGTIEGIARMDWNGGGLVWVEDCHGDTYGLHSTEDVVYSVGHAHYCGNIPGGFHQNEPWDYYRGQAFTKKTTQNLRTEIYNYTNFGGQPAPSLLHWLPRIDSGTFTGQGQGAWTITGNDDYLVLGGEFPRAGTRAQQGLVRFAQSGPTSGLETSPALLEPTVRATGSGEMLVSWRTTWDRDNENLTYRLVRNGNNANPVDVRTVASAEWRRPHVSFLDTGLTPGQQVTYRVFASDGTGNEVASNIVTATVGGSGSTPDYVKAVTRDGPQHYWRFGETSGSDVADLMGRGNATTFGGVDLGSGGLLDGDSAATFSGASTQTMATQNAEYQSFQYSVEAWFRTTTIRGGKIVGSANVRSGASTNSRYDRHLYMDNSGRINFGTRQGTANTPNRVLTSQAGLNNGQWHHAVGVVSDKGMELYVDGVRVGYRADTFTGFSYNGFWRVGGDNLSGWANRPTSDYFAGDIDEVAVYSHPLTGKQVRDHFLASGRALAAVPTDAYGKAVYEDGPSTYWRLAETSGTTAADSSVSGAAGSYLNGPVLGGPSAVGVGSDRSAGFDGTNDNVAGNVLLSAPRTFSAEGWFRTTTSQGGKLFGFGSSRTGASGTADRHVYMTDDGTLRFGTLSGGVQTIVQSAQAYNDGAWHHVVATQGPAGMRLYVDGLQVATSPQSANTAYNGYWRAGGDSLAGWADRPSSDYFAGSLDEVAFYERALSQAQVADHFAKGGGTVPNQPPTAAFTATPTNLSVAFNSSASSDPDGSIASRSWSFGDGNSSTQANPTHVYATEGTYTVSLTVTDNEGATGTVTQQVTVTAPPNQAPNASFTLSQDLLSIQVNGSGSSDPDGSIASYSWNWGDNTANGSGATAAHTYAEPGTYTVTLTVTDNRGATGSTTRSVTVSSVQGPVAADSFGRTATNGWGSADVGGSWTHTGPAGRWSVSGGRGVYTMPSAGVGAWNRLTDVSARDVVGTVDWSADKASTGGGLYFAAAARVQGGSEYRFNNRVLSDGTVRTYLTRVVNGTETQLGAAADIPGLTVNANDVLRMRFEVSGGSTATLSATVWKAGQAQPGSPQVTRTDTTPALSGPGGVGVYTYGAGSITNAPVTASFDNLEVLGDGAAPPPANQAPQAAFVVSSQSGLAIGVDGSGSSDPDGSIASYSWNWGDNTANGTGVTASHTYANPGTYTVTLTVTDNQGATASTTRTVTVSTGQQQPVAADAFGRSVTGGWGNADTGGAWTSTGPAARWSVAGGKGVYTMPSAGVGAWNRLTGVSAADVTGTVDFSVDKAITGGGLYNAMAARVQGSSEYRFNTRFLADGTVRVYVTRVVNGTETQVGAAVDVPGLSYAAGDVLRYRFSVSGTSSASLTMTVWKVGQAEPAGPQLVRSDTTPLTGAGGVGVYAYLTGSATNAPVVATFDDLEVLPLG